MSGHDPRCDCWKMDYQSMLGVLDEARIQCVRFWVRERKDIETAKAVESMCSNYVLSSGFVMSSGNEPKARQILCEGVHYVAQLDFS